MADILTFEAGLGESSGALAVAGTPSGLDALIVGDTAHPPILVADGEDHEVYQLATIPALTTLVRIAVTLACLEPEDIAASWVFAVTRDGAPRISLPIWRKSYLRPLNDVALPINPAGETIEIGLRLAFSLDGGGEAEERLPAAYVDALVEDDAAVPRYVLINRNPEPGETDVPLDVTISIEVHDTAWDDITLASAFTIEIEGALAWSAAGGFETGFDGPGSLVELLDSGTTWRITIDPTTDFASQTEISVGVSYTPLSGPGDAILTSYNFVTEDKTAPRLMQGAVLGHRTIRATFNEAMTVEDVLEPTHWTITLVSTSLDNGLPALEVAVVSVAVVPTDPASFDLTLDDDMTAGAQYLLHVGHVTDLNGNTVDPAYDEVIVIGYACPIPDGRRFDIIRWLPEHNVAADHPRNGGDRALEALIKVWQHLFDRTLCDVDRWTEIFDPDRAPEPFVDAMLADLGVSIYGPRRTPLAFFGLEGAEKRRLLRALIPLYKKKGTPDGIAEAVLIFLGLTVTIHVPTIEGGWVLGVSHLAVDTTLTTDEAEILYSFYIASPIALTDDQRAWIERFAQYSKPCHVHFIGFIEPAVPPSVDHWALSLSALAVNTILHGGAPP